MHSSYNGPVYGYIAKNGVLKINDADAVKLKFLKSNNKKLPEMSEHDILKLIKNKFEDNDLDLKKWIRKLIKNRKYRLNTIDKLSKENIKPKIFPWNVLNVKVKGYNID